MIKLFSWTRTSRNFKFFFAQDFSTRFWLHIRDELWCVRMWGFLQSSCKTCHESEIFSFYRTTRKWNGNELENKTARMSCLPLKTHENFASISCKFVSRFYCSDMQMRRFTDRNVEQRTVKRRNTGRRSIYRHRAIFDCHRAFMLSVRESPCSIFSYSKLSFWPPRDFFIQLNKLHSKWFSWLTIWQFNISRQLALCFCENLWLQIISKFIFP